MNAPKLRFVFSNNTETTPEKIAIISDYFGKVSSGRSKPFSNGKYPLYGSTGIIGKVEIPEYKGNKILIARVGANAGSLQFVSEPCGITDNTLVINDSETCSLRWLFYYLSSKDLNKISFGSGQPLIKGTTISTMPISVPTKKEQQKIADFLSTVDEKIALKNKKYTALVEAKKGLLQKIFSQEIRFKRDGGGEYPEWEDCTLSSIGEFVRGLSYSKDNVVREFSGQETVILRSNNIADDFLHLDNELQFVTKKPNSSQFLKSGDIVICTANGSNKLVGKTGQYKGSVYTNITVGAFCCIFRSNYPIVSWLFQSVNYKVQLRDALQGGSGAIGNLGIKSLGDFIFAIPCFEEQQKIAGFLSAYDEKIEAVSRELEGWKAIKKGLLQQMFC